MDHAEAIYKDAELAIDTAALLAPPDGHASSLTPRASSQDTRAAQSKEEKPDSRDRHKRKGDFPDTSQRHGGRGGRDDRKRHKKGDMGRGEYFATNPDRRQRNEDAHARRQREGIAGQGIQFSKEEIDAEERKPKRKVAVMIGYSGTGYKGMQISGTEKTIEGDLFQAFIKAGAISKANAEDPKKSSLVRCARTDKGVHAAGNMISLKLIVEEPDIVEKINAELTPQIRVWGIERTTGSFSCYQACDSRWYEYLIPSHAFLPPHPSSWLAKQTEKLADETGEREAYDARQEEVHGFWEKVDNDDIKPILDTFEEDIRWDVIKALQGEEEASAKAVKTATDPEQQGSKVKIQGKREEATEGKSEEAVIIINGLEGNPNDHPPKPADSVSTAAPEDVSNITTPQVQEEAQPQPEETDRIFRLRAATKRLRNAYVTAKLRYRIPSQRISRIQAALNKYLGTKNYHNYTVQKVFKEPSVNRHIKSFVVNPKPILIGDGPEAEKTEWLSLKVHGQSFMMHQIRKMVGMVTLLVRSGSNLDTMDESFKETRFSIPKVPGLGLLLERPVFDTYNNVHAVKHGREPLVFGKYEQELEAFKEREIYQRIFREEEERNEFGRFFNHVDNFKEPYFMFVASGGIEVTKGIERKQAAGESDSE